MRALFKTDLKFDWKVVTITIVSTLLLMADYYVSITKNWIGGVWWKVADRTILYFIIPMLIILVVFRENPRNFGFTLGDWRAGLVLTLGGILLMAPILWLLNRSDTSMQDYYRSSMSGLPWNTFADLFGWEFLFRGWILFGYARKFGPEALSAQELLALVIGRGIPKKSVMSIAQELLARFGNIKAISYATIERFSKIKPTTILSAAPSVQKMI